MSSDDELGRRYDAGRGLRCKAELSSLW
jgi:hypothetical protein